MAKKNIQTSNLIKAGNFERFGESMSNEVGSLLLEELRNDAELAESVDFKEDNTMANSTQLHTTVLANYIYSKQYDKFQKYRDVVVNLTPQMLGQMPGAGVYKIPKILGATAGKLAPGEKVEYVNKNKEEVLLETDTYGVGTSITRRLIKRGATGFIQKLMDSGSKSVWRAISAEIGNSLVAGADANNTIGNGISVDNIADAVKNVNSAKDSNGVHLGLNVDKLIMTTEGKNVLTKSADYKTIYQYGQSNVPGNKIETQYKTYDTMEIVELELITATKGGNVVHAIVMDSENFLAFLQETEMEVFDGRIQGTAGDQEVIHAIDCGMAVLSIEAAAVITA